MDVAIQVVMEAKTILWKKFGRPSRKTFGWPKRNSGKPSGASGGLSSAPPTLCTAVLLDLGYCRVVEGIL